jgi:hypothetical protein
MLDDPAQPATPLGEGPWQQELKRVLLCCIPQAVRRLPAFNSVPGATDRLLVAMSNFLHALAEHTADRWQKVQYGLVPVLALTALFTQGHASWIVGLLLALIALPDFATPPASITRWPGSMAMRGIDAALVPRRHLDFQRLHGQSRRARRQEPRASLHATAAIGLVHATMLHVQALLLPIQTLVLKGH